jgi:hypothetical protein
MDLQIIMAFLFLAGIVVFLILRGKDLRPPGERRKTTVRAEDLEPHACNPGAFLPCARTTTRRLGTKGTFNVGFFDFSGRMAMEEREYEYGVVIFEGVFCPSCGARLACLNCRTTPTEEIVLNSEEERRSYLLCCDRPAWWAVKERTGAIEVVDAAPAAQKLGVVPDAPKEAN